MSKDLLSTIGPGLHAHALATSFGMNADRAIQLVTNKDLSFTGSKASLTNIFRDQLKAIAKSVDVNMNAILGMLTTEQLSQVVADHKHFKWNTKEGEGYLTGLTFSGGKWMLSFDTHSLEYDYSYELHDLEIQDVLGLLATCENVMGL